MIITVTSQKGGVGKTTTAVTLAHGLAMLHASTILADLDPQGHDAISLGLDQAPGIFQYFVSELYPAECLVDTDRANLRLLPGNSRTKTAQTVAQTEHGFDATRLRLCQLGELADAIVLDTGAEGLFQEAAIAAADAVVIPARLEALSLDGVAATVKAAQKLNPAAAIRILPTALDKRVLEHDRNLTVLRTAFQGLVADAVPQRIAVAEASACGQTLWEYATNGVLDAYQELVEWLAEQMGEVQHG